MRLFKLSYIYLFLFNDSLNYINLNNLNNKKYKYDNR